MFETVTYLRQLYEDARPNADPRTKDWFLLSGSPIPVWCLTILYLLFVWLAPKYMRHRPAFSLQYLMFVYNMSLVGLSVYMFVEIILSISDAGYGFICSSYNERTRREPKELRVASVLWWYFFSKAVELMDTVLMVLRKKSAQITFLHVFHHATMLNIWWWVTTFIPGGLSWFGSCLNCLVHVVMYSYYGLSVIPSLKGKLWWKRYITRFQLIQFFITLSHTLYSIHAGCDFPRWGQYLLASYMIFMLILFTNFYVHAYVLKRRRDLKQSDNNCWSASAPVIAGDDAMQRANGHKNGVVVTNGYGTTKKQR
jgi:elongation of very long chain fatty acids protein 2/elongation of very long chain fatty acids protein 5